MLEHIAGARRPSPLVEQLRLNQLRQPRLQGRLVQGHNGLEHVVGKLAPHHRPQLGHVPGGAKPIQAGHKRILQGGGNRHRAQGSSQHIVLRVLLQQVGLQEHLGELFDKQRHAIGLGHNVRHHLRWQCLASGQVRNQGLHLRALKAIQSDGLSDGNGSARAAQTRGER